MSSTQKARRGADNPTGSDQQLHDVPTLPLSRVSSRSLRDRCRRHLRLLVRRITARRVGMGASPRQTGRAMSGSSDFAQVSRRHRWLGREGKDVPRSESPGQPAAIPPAASQELWPPPNQVGDGQSSHRPQQSELEPLGKKGLGLNVRSLVTAGGAPRGERYFSRRHAPAASNSRKQVVRPPHSRASPAPVRAKVA
jgi:hypothetical protein